MRSAALVSRRSIASRGHLRARRGQGRRAPHHLSRRVADDADALSTRLKSRAETGEALRDSGVPVVARRASIGIGAGSQSFEVIRALVELLPAMICPRWVDSRTQPIAIDDVLAYLRAALELPEGREGVSEIGGPRSSPTATCCASMRGCAACGACCCR